MPATTQYPKSTQVVHRDGCIYVVAEDCGNSLRVYGAEPEPQEFETIYKSDVVEVYESPAFQPQGTDRKSYLLGVLNGKTKQEIIAKWHGKVKLNKAWRKDRIIGAIIERMAG